MLACYSFSTNQPASSSATVSQAILVVSALNFKHTTTLLKVNSYSLTQNTSERLRKNCQAQPIQFDGHYIIFLPFSDSVSNGASLIKTVQLLPVILENLGSGKLRGIHQSLGNEPTFPLSFILFHWIFSLESIANIHENIQTPCALCKQ